MNTTDKEFAMANEIDTSGTAGKIAVMQAFAEGNRIEGSYRLGTSGWCTHTKPNWDWTSYDYRISQQPKTRPLRASDWDGLPVVWVRLSGKSDEMLVTSIGIKGFNLSEYFYAWGYLERHVWSVDRKTWKPFTVEDTQ